jgi:Flp pilus assembly protein TadD
MTSVFLSYDRDDAARAGEIAAALEGASYSVWWDQRIRGGAQYSHEIEQALRDSDVIVVLWSKSAVESAWVRDEAAEGRDRGKLVPVALDSARPPIGFRQFQTIDLSKGLRTRSGGGVQQLLEAVAHAAGAELSAAAIAPPRTKRPRPPILILAAAVAIAVALAAFMLLEPFGKAGTGAVSAAVMPADASPASKELADDLLAKLGGLSLQDGGPLRLLGAGQSSQAAFRFELGASTEHGQSRANLLLLDGRSSTLLWSGQFERAAARVGDLRQEIAFTATAVLRCALDAYRSQQLATKLDLLKTYLNGCAAMIGDDPPQAHVAAFRQIVKAAPAFVGGWSQLLFAEAGIAEPDAGQRRQIAADIAAARKLRADLPAAYAAEVGLLRPDDYRGALALFDRGLAHNPEDASLLGGRGEMLFSVGRTADAVADAKRSSELDSTSPIARANYIYTLANSGRVAAALAELARAERDWPGSSDLARVKYIVNSRYGDPKVAEAFMESSAFEGNLERGRIYLEARLHPTTANIDRAIADGRAAYAAHPEMAVHLMQVYGMFQRTDDLLAMLMTLPLHDAIGYREVYFRPTTRALWRDPRSLRFARRIGLLQYWTSSGKWPDFCSEPHFPYDCRTEAAKLTG